MFTNKYYEYFDDEKMKELRERYERGIKESQRRKDKRREKFYSKKLWLIYQEMIDRQLV